MEQINKAETQKARKELRENSMKDAQKPVTLASVRPVHNFCVCCDVLGYLRFLSSYLHVANMSNEQMGLEREDLNFWWLIF